MQFWIWTNNNCAPATYMTVMELVCARLKMNVNSSSLFGQVVKSRGKMVEGRMHHLHLKGMFDAFHRKFAGCIEGTCIIPSHRKKPVSSCCAYSHYCTFTAFMEHTDTIMNGSDQLLRLFQVKQKRRVTSMPRLQFAHFAFTEPGGQNAKGNLFLSTAVKTAPIVLHCSLDHQSKRRATATDPGQSEKRTTWDFHPVLQLMCSRTQVPVHYQVAAIVYGNDMHWVSISVDSNGG